jgi:trigger factor
MEITKQNIDELNAVLKVSLAKEDYHPQFETALKNYAKKVNMKGFRPGHAPVSMVKKMYGKSLLADEINRILNDALYHYISENKLDILGNPMPKQEDENIDWDNPGVMNFSYELGLAPVFSIDFSKISFPFYKVQVNDELIAKQIDDLTRRYGKLVSAEVSEKSDMLMGTFEELGDDKNVKEGGIKHENSTIAIEHLHDDELKQKLSGLKVGDAVEIDPRKVSHSSADMAAMLGVEKEQIDSVSRNFRFTVTEIKRIEPAVLDQDFFNKIFGEGQVNSLEEMNAKIGNDLAGMFNNDSNSIFDRDVVEHLISSIEMQLPDQFIKRWIVASNEKPVTPEQVENDYPSYSRGLKWQLIENKVIKDNDIKVDQGEVLEFTKSYLAGQYMRYGIPTPPPEEITQSAMRILGNKDESKRIYQDLYGRKVMNVIKAAIKLDEKEVTLDEFKKIANPNGEHEHHHDHDHDHDH